MKYSIFSLAAVFLLFNACQEQSTMMNYESYEDYPVYEGNDLGVTYTPKQTTVKVWSPAAEAMRFQLYDKGEESKIIATHKMKRQEKGVWITTIDEDLKGKYYTVQTKINEIWLSSVPDPYAKAVGVNGHRGMIVDLAATNPEGWATDKKPVLDHFNDIIIYELHVRDLSSHPNSGIKNSGKFLGLTETGATSPEGEITGLDHIKDLGVTHIHLLPVFDFLPRSVDEKNPKAKFNWGYDPQNYNVPEGSYATDPYDGTVRIREFKQMVKTLHDNGLRVVMDVVYNHTGDTETSNFNQIAPGYYYRQNADSTFSNASGCGNETASERSMMRKFMIESLKYWAEEYHIDGFRVDLMGIHDIETMNLISAELEKIDPTVFVYGEGWTAGDSPLPNEKRTIKHHTPQLNRIAAFSDDIRDGLKGSVFNREEGGFVSGKKGMEETMKFGVVAATQHPQIDYAKVNYSDAYWANEPSQCITYVSCHDNHTLYDKLKISRADASETDIIKMDQLALTMILTSQGVPFLHAGVELLRTKFGEENSYQSPDSVNQFVWERKTTYKKHYNYVKGLIALRKNHPAFRMTSTEMITKHLQFLEPNQEDVVAYTISDNANGDSWHRILVILNGNAEKVNLSIPEGKWRVVLESGSINEDGGRLVAGINVEVNGISAMILVE